VPPTLGKQLAVMRDGSPIMVNGKIGDLISVAAALGLWAAGAHGRFADYRHCDFGLNREGPNNVTGGISLNQPPETYDRH
jgi:hypothetical protein